MKEYTIVASTAPVTTVNVAGTPHHYFHSKQLGKCRMIHIAEDVNLEAAPKPYATKPLSTDEQLEALMDCGERLQKRYYQRYLEYCSMPDDDFIARNAFWEKMESLHKARSRVTARICRLLDESR